MGELSRGWYDCPSGLRQIRLFDGRCWTARVDWPETDVADSPMGTELAPPSPGAAPGEAAAVAPPPELFRPPFAPAPPSVDVFPVPAGEPPPGTPGVFVRPEAHQMAFPVSPRARGARVPEMTEVASAVLADAVRRRPGWSAVWRVAFVVPSAVLSMAALAAVQQILLRTVHVEVAEWKLLVVWWALFPLALLSPVQLAAHRLSKGLDQPFGVEADTLEQAWERLRERAGIAPGRARILVCRNNEKAVHAPIGRVLVVAERDILDTEPAVLDALLAHQVGHQVRWHTLLRITLLWARLPVLLTWLLVAAAALALKKMFEYCTQDHVSGMERLVAAAFAAVLVLASLPLLLPAAVGKFCGLVSELIDRRGEREADQVACELGAGMALLTHLEETARHGTITRSGVETVLFLPPLITTRARRIRRFLNTPGSTPPPARPQPTVPPQTRQTQYQERPW